MLQYVEKFAIQNGTTKSINIIKNRHARRACLRCVGDVTRLNVAKKSLTSESQEPENVKRLILCTNDIITLYAQCFRGSWVDYQISIFGLLLFLRNNILQPRAQALKVRLHDATKLMRHATCDKIALCKRAYLCDMRLLHAVAGKLKSSNFLATIACRNKPVYIARF